MRSILAGIKNILLWSYERGSWQYDLLCLLIVATIFLMPSRYFGDRDRSPSGQANSRGELASKDSANIREVDLREFLLRENRTDLLNSPKEAISIYLKAKLNREVELKRLEQVFNGPERTVYRVWYD